MLVLLSSARDGNGSKYEIRTCRWLMLLGRYGVDFAIFHEGLVQIIPGDGLDFSSAWLGVGIWGTLSWQRLSLLSSLRQVVWQLMPADGLKSVCLCVGWCLVCMCVSGRLLNWQASVFECTSWSYIYFLVKNKVPLSWGTIGKRLIWNVLYFLALCWIIKL